MKLKLLTAAAVAVGLTLAGVTAANAEEVGSSPNSDTQAPSSAAPTAPETDIAPDTAATTTTSESTAPTSPNSEAPTDSATPGTEPTDTTAPPTEPETTGPISDTPPAPTPVEGWWLMPNGGTAENVTWPQTATTANNVPCGVTAQVDTYPSQEARDALAADGVLTLGEDYGIAQSWRFVYGGDCPPQPGPANPKANLAKLCGVIHVEAENPGENILTASIVVYSDGDFYQALAIGEGEHQQLDVTYPEDSGEHTVTVRTGPAFGDIELGSITVDTDCEAVVVPPTDTPTPTPTPAPAPAAAAPAAAVAAEAVTPTETLAQTGSTVDLRGYAFLAGMLVLLGAAGIIGARGISELRSRKARG